MSKKSSEQLLSGLEHSQRPVLELFDDVTEIIGSSWKQTTNGYYIKIRHSSNQDSTFREQWVLRWLIKKLGQALGLQDRQGKKQPKSEIEKEDDGLIQDGRTWLLFSHLLSGIPSAKTQEILIDRRFCPILNVVLNLISQKLVESFRPSSGSAQSRLSDDASGRPLKKRRLSEDIDDGKMTLNRLSWSELAQQLMRITTHCAMILSGYQGDHKIESETMTFAWADDIDAASALVGSIAKIAHLTLNDTAGHDFGTTAKALLATDHWLRLWSKYSSSGLTDSKQDPHTSFNSLILKPALTMLSLKSRAPATEGFQVLERQIAIHTVLPARSTFQKHNAAIRTSRGNLLRDKDIERLTREIWKVLLPTANNSPDWHNEVDTTLLLAIASRLIPRSDVVRRKSESSWFEIFFLSLVQILFAPSEARKPHHSDTLQLNSIEEQNLERLIDTFAILDVIPSAPVWRYFNEHYVLAKGLNVSYTLLKKIVRLNASVFVYHSGFEDFSLAGAIKDRIPLSIDLESNTQKLDVVELLCIILDEYGKTGQFPKFLELWKTKLVETFHDRATTAPASSNEQRRYVWDDPDMLRAFRTAFRQYAPPSLCRETLDEAGRGLQGLPALVGPAHQICTQLTLATQVLKSGVLQVSLQKSIAEQLQGLAGSVCLALARSTDYQGHRWRLYDFLATIIQIDSRIEWVNLFELPSIINLLAQSGGANTDGDEISKMCAISMERYHFLHVVATSFEAGHVGVEELLNNVVNMINQLLEDHIQKSQSVYSKSMPWDGTTEGIRQPDVLLSVCLIRLATMPGYWLSNLKAPDKLLINLTKLMLNDPSSNNFGESCLTRSAEILLRSVIETPTLDVQAIILQTVVDYEGQVRRLPALLRTLPGQKMQRSMGGLSDCLLEHLAQQGPAVAERFLSDSLALLSTTSTKLANHLSARDNFRKCLSGMQQPTADADLMTFISIVQHIESFAQTIVKEPQSAEEIKKWPKNILNICKILKKETRIFQSKAEQQQLDNYDGFLLIAVAKQLHGLQSQREDQKIHQMIGKIESRLRKQALEQTSKLLEERVNAVRIFKATKLLGTLLDLANNEFITSKNITKLKELHEQLKTSLLEKSQKTSNNLEIIILKWAKTELDRLVTLNQPILGSSSPPMFLADKSQRQTRKADLEVEACLALGQSFLAPDATCAPLVALIATGNKDAFLAQSLSEDTKLLFAVAATAKNIKSEVLSQSPEIVKAFGQIANLESALQSWTPVGLVLRLELSKIIFEQHPNIINQHIIDTTLSNMTLLTSSANKLTLGLNESPENPHPQHIFDRICQLLTTILTRHRRRLTGRHHLLLPTLQSLLKCLFYPPTRHQQYTSSTNPNPATATIAASEATFLSSLPHWLNPPSHTSTHTLPTTSASKFSRVLQTLCDPSASSARRTVSKRRRGNSSASAAAADNHDLNLVDETRLLRRQVAQHTQYLLQTYCQAMLDGWISPDVREKLALGLFAVCNATDVEVMKALNSAMDESQRAIWKDLYAEWTRWGKWNQR